MTDEPRTNLPKQRVRATWIVGTILILAVVGVLLVPLERGYRAIWYGEAQDFCHVLLFGLLAYLLGSYAFPNRLVWVMLGAACLAGLAEIVQPLSGRSASWRDAAYGILGAGMAAAWLHKAWPWPLRLAIVALLAAWPVIRTGPVVLDAVYAWSEFPVLAGSSSLFEPTRWLLYDVSMQPGQGSSRLTFPPREQGSGAILFPVVCDWTGYETLEVAFEFAGPPLRLLISVRDGKVLPPELPRFDLWRTYEPGRHVVRIDLNELAQGGSFPPIELDRVQSLHLVAYSDQTRVVDLHGIRLMDKKPPHR